MAFGYLFSIHDRHGGNWVWSPRSQKLLMIDTEDSFGPTPSFPNEYADLAAIFRDCANRPEAVATAARGFQEVFSHFNRRQGPVRHLLAHSGFAAGFVSPHATGKADVLVAQWISDLGL